MRPRKQAAYGRPSVSDQTPRPARGAPQHVFVLPHSVTFKLNRIHLNLLGRQQSLITNLEHRVAQLEGQLGALGTFMHNQDASMRAQNVHIKLQEDRIATLEKQISTPTPPLPPQPPRAGTLQEQLEDPAWQLPGWQDVENETHSPPLEDKLDDLLELVEDHHRRLYDLEHDDNKTKDLTLHDVACIKNMVKDAVVRATISCMKRQEDQLAFVQEQIGRDHVVLTQSVARLTQEMPQREHDKQPSIAHGLASGSVSGMMKGSQMNTPDPVRRLWD